MILSREIFFFFSEYLKAKFQIEKFAYFYSTAYCLFVIIGLSICEFEFPPVPCPSAVDINYERFIVRAVFENNSTIHLPSIGRLQGWRRESRDRVCRIKGSEICVKGFGTSAWRAAKQWGRPNSIVRNAQIYNRACTKHKGGARWLWCALKGSCWA